MQRLCTLTCLALLAQIAGISVAHANVDSTQDHPWFKIELPIELQWDNTVDADDPLAEISDLYVTIEPTIEIGLASWLTAEIGLVFEPVLDPAPGDDRTFADHGLFAETAQLIAAFGPLTVNAGKFSAPFSIAYEYAPGIYGDVLNADIEITERLGFSLAYNLINEGTEQGIILRAGALTRDTGFLSGSIITQRERLTLSDGGAGNTEQLDTFALALDVIDLENVPGLHLHAAYLHQPAGLGDTADQNAFVVGANWTIEASENATYELLAEWAHSDDAVGFSDAIGRDNASQTDWTVAASGIWAERWTAAIGFSHRDIDDPVEGDATIRAIHASVGYKIAEELLAEIAYLDLNDTAGDSQTLGLRLTFETEVNSGNAPD